MRWNKDQASLRRERIANRSRELDVARVRRVKRAANDDGLCATRDRPSGDCGRVVVQRKHCWGQRTRQRRAGRIHWRVTAARDANSKARRAPRQPIKPAKRPTDRLTEGAHAPTLSASNDRRPRRLAWPRTLPFHGRDMGSNPIGVTSHRPPIGVSEWPTPVSPCLPMLRGWLSDPCRCLPSPAKSFRSKSASLSTSLFAGPAVGALRQA